jgi:hypothetical protein
MSARITGHARVKISKMSIGCNLGSRPFAQQFD